MEAETQASRTTDRKQKDIDICVKAKIINS